MRRVLLGAAMAGLDHRQVSGTVPVDDVSDGDLELVGRFAELVERSEAVAVATPTGSHAELTVTAAQAGRPVFCEKPLSLDRATTVATIEAVEAAGVPLRQPPERICRETHAQLVGDGAPEGALEWPSLLRRLDAERPRYRT